MKRVLLSTTILLLVVLTGDRTLSFVLNKLVSLSSFRYTQLYTQSLSNDIIFIGNSRGVNSFYTPYLKEKYGLETINLSYNGLPPGLMFVLASDYIENHKKPKVLVIEISNLYQEKKPQPLITDGTMREYSLYCGYSDKLMNLLKAYDPNTYYLNNIFHLSRFNSEFFLRNFYYIFKSDQDWINRYKINNSLIAEVEKMDSVRFFMGKENIPALVDFISSVEKQGVRVILFCSPYLPAYREKISNLDSIIAEINSQTGKRVIDFSGNFSEISFFADRVHTNDVGAKALADSFMVYMREP